MTTGPAVILLWQKAVKCEIMSNRNPIKSVIISATRGAGVPEGIDSRQAMQSGEHEMVELFHAFHLLQHTG